MITNFQEVRNGAKKFTPIKIAVAAADDSDVLKAIEDARLSGIADAILIGVK